MVKIGIFQCLKKGTLITPKLKYLAMEHHLFWKQTRLIATIVMAITFIPLSLKRRFMSLGLKGYLPE